MKIFKEKKSTFRLSKNVIKSAQAHKKSDQLFGMNEELNFMRK